MLEIQKQLKRLLTNSQSVILSTSTLEVEPNASYAPFVTDKENNIYIYISSFAKHSSNLKKNPKVSAMFIEDEGTAENLFARKRLTLSCDVKIIERDTVQFTEGMDTFKDRFGKTIDNLRDLADFTLFRLTPKIGLLVLGFGAAYRVIGIEAQAQSNSGSGKGHVSVKKNGS